MLDHQQPQGSNRDYTIATDPGHAKADGDDAMSSIENLAEAMRQDESRSELGAWAIPLASLIRSHPNQAEPVIDGLLRRGEVMNVIAAPKIGKTWLTHGLARSVASGSEWLGFPTTKGRVLIIDGELHATELAKRLRTVAPEFADDSNGPIDVVSLRGRIMDIDALAGKISKDGPGSYSMIIIDALYRFLPQKCSENDNAQMMQVYNTIDRIAMQANAAVVVVHHSSKGDQSSKSVTDMGAGAGSIARATDTHLAIRPHEEEGLAVMQSVCRSFIPPDDISIGWEFPYWNRAPWKPVLATRQSANDDQKRKRDEYIDNAIRSILKERPLSIAEMRSRILNPDNSSIGKERIEGSLKRLKAIGKRAKGDGSGKDADRYQLSETD